MIENNFVCFYHLHITWGYIEKNLNAVVFFRIRISIEFEKFEKKNKKSNQKNNRILEFVWNIYLCKRFYIELCVYIQEKWWCKKKFLENFNFRKILN